MSVSPLPMLLIGLFIVLGFGVLWAGVINQGKKKLSWIWIGLSLLPSVVFLVLFVSLAIHMHFSLGGWPSSIGDSGFPPPLISHANLAAGYFGFQLFLSATLWPILCVGCTFQRSWRYKLLYLGVYFIGFVVALGSIFLLPAQFLDWWLD